jgi:WD40 repeat protein
MARITVFRPAIPREVTAIDASPNGNVVVSARGEGNGARIEIWDGDVGRKAASFHIPHEIVRKLRYLPAENQIITHGHPGRTRCWEAGSCREVSSLTIDETDLPSPLSFAEIDQKTTHIPIPRPPAAAKAESIPKGTDSIIADECVQIVREEDGSVSSWRTDSGVCLNRWLGVPPGKLVAAVPRPSQLLIKSDSHSLLMWDLEGKYRRFLISYNFARHPEIPRAKTCAVLNWLVLADTKMTLLNITSGKTIWSCRPGRDMGSAVTALGTFADGRHLVTATLDGALRLWRVSDGERLATFPADSRIGQLLVRGSRLIAGSGMGTVYFLELKGIDLVRPLLELWPDSQGDFFGRCPHCGWTGTWRVNENSELAACPSCGDTSVC